MYQDVQKRAMFSSSDFPLKVRSMLLQDRYVMICIEMATHQSRKIQPTESSLLGSNSMTLCLICRNGSGSVCDKLNGKDRKDTSRIHFLKLKPILFLILSRGHLIPDPSQVML